MHHLFLPHKLAEALKQKDYPDKYIFACYDSLKGNVFEEFTNAHLIDEKYKERYVTAPMYQQVVDWFREKHNLLIYVVPFKDHASDVNDPLEWNWAIHNKQIGRGITTYYEALNKAIEEAATLI